MRKILLSVVAAAGGVLVTGGTASGSHTSAPSSVTIAGNLQSVLGCSGDWDPACAETHLVYDADDDVWQATWTLPAASYEYKAALNDSWEENYPAANKAFTAPGGDVTFLYDHKTHLVVDSISSVIATAPGSYQSELGCPGDWDPGCLRAWLQDPERDGTYTFETTALPAGSYETKAAINQAWDENYGAGGQQNGANIAFQVAFNGQTVRFTYNAATHVLTVVPVVPAPVDTDADGVPDTADVCPGTVLPDRATALKKNRYETDAAGRFVSTNGTAVATISDTHGCSLHQIVAAAGLGLGQLKYGITRTELNAWIARTAT